MYGLAQVPVLTICALVLLDYCVRGSFSKEWRHEGRIMSKSGAVLILLVSVFVLSFVYAMRQSAGPPVVVNAPSVDNSAPRREPISKSEPGAITDQSFSTVAEIVAKAGARAERDPQARNTVRVYVPASVSLTLTEMQAKVLAGRIREQLGSKAIVYIKDESGVTLGKVGPFD